jgi:hydroxymethylpyrimidine pyrophosphatase-like HAD family hydrolase
MDQATPIVWNKDVKLIFSDVDETIADVYQPAVPEMITELEKILQEGKLLFLLTGAGLQSIQERITNVIRPELRRDILIAHCNGVEVWGFDINGELHPQPYYSLYEQKLTEQQKKDFRVVVEKLLIEFKLKKFPTMPKADFRKLSNEDPLSIMVADRKAQITFELVNASDLNAEQAEALEVTVPMTHGSYDLRIPVLERAEQLFAEYNVPVTPRLGGTCAIDFAVEGVSKTTAIHWFLDNEEILRRYDLQRNQLLRAPRYMEIWGDKFSAVRGGPDRHISEGLPKEVRSIDFREEDPAEMAEGYNIQIWRGKHHLHEGLLEYLQSRMNTSTTL